MLEILEDNVKTNCSIIFAQSEHAYAATNAPTEQQIRTKFYSVLVAVRRCSKVSENVHKLLAAAAAGKWMSASGGGIEWADAPPARYTDVATLFMVAARLFGSFH